METAKKRQNMNPWFEGETLFCISFLWYPKFLELAKITLVQIKISLRRWEKAVAGLDAILSVSQHNLQVVKKKVRTHIEKRLNASYEKQWQESFLIILVFWIEYLCIFCDF